MLAIKQRALETTRQELQIYAHHIRHSIPVQDICLLVSSYLEMCDPFFWFEEEFLSTLI